MKEKQAPMIVTKRLKHVFTPEETAALNTEFRQSYANLKAVESEFDNVKAVWKAKQTEAESRMETLNATLQAGFDMRDEKCICVFRPEVSKKDFYVKLPDGEAYPSDNKPVLTEDMTAEDFQQDLIRAEACFEKQAKFDIFQPVNCDFGILIVGCLAGRWFSALRIKIGAKELTERMDSESKSFKQRADAIRTAAKRASEWFAESLGKDAAKGFSDNLAAIVENEKEKAE